MQHGRSWRWPPVLGAAVAAFCVCVGELGATEPLQERIKLCGTCHGRAGNSNMENTPSLAGQPALFLTNQMILMRDKLRASQVMVPFVQGLSDSEITALAEYYARLTPERTGEPIDAGLARRGAEIANTLYCASCHLPSYSGREQIPVSYRSGVTT